MKTTAVIEALTILQKYRDKTDGFDVGAEHDTLYAYATDRAVCDVDVVRLIDLGWFQEDAITGGEDFALEHYDREESWACYT